MVELKKPTLAMLYVASVPSSKGMIVGRSSWIYSSGIAPGRPKVMLRLLVNAISYLASRFKQKRVSYLSNSTQPNQVRFLISCSIGVNLAITSLEWRPMDKAALTAKPWVVHVWTDRCVPCKYWLVSNKYCTVLTVSFLELLGLMSSATYRSRE